MGRVYTWGLACFGALGIPEYCDPTIPNQKRLNTRHYPVSCN